MCNHYACAHNHVVHYRLIIVTMHNSSNTVQEQFCVIQDKTLNSEIEISVAVYIFTLGIVNIIPYIIILTNRGLLAMGLEVESSKEQEHKKESLPRHSELLSQLKQSE